MPVAVVALLCAVAILVFFVVSLVWIWFGDEIRLRRQRVCRNCGSPLATEPHPIGQPKYHPRTGVRRQMYRNFRGCTGNCAYPDGDFIGRDYHRPTEEDA